MIPAINSYNEFGLFTKIRTTIEWPFPSGMELLANRSPQISHKS